MKAVHILNRFGQNGVSAGIINLAREGFYDGCDIRIIALAKGEAKTYDILCELLGPEHITFLSADDKPQLSKDFLRYTRALRKQIQEFNPQIAICSNSISLLIARTAALVNSELVLASFMHSTKCEGAMMRTALRLTSFRDDVVLGDASITLQEAVPLLFLTRPPKHVVPLVIPELCRPREKRDVRSFNILSLGRLHPEKNYTELIYAAALLKREGYSGS